KTTHPHADRIPAVGVHGSPAGRDHLAPGTGSWRLGQRKHESVADHRRVCTADLEQAGGRTARRAHRLAATHPEHPRTRLSAHGGTQLAGRITRTATRERASWAALRNVCRGHAKGSYM